MTDDLLKLSDTDREMQDKIKRLFMFCPSDDMVAYLRQSLEAAAATDQHQPEAQKAPSPGYNQVVTGGYLPRRGP